VRAMLLQALGLHSRAGGRHRSTTRPSAPHDEPANAHSFGSVSDQIRYGGLAFRASRYRSGRPGVDQTRELTELHTSQDMAHVAAMTERCWISAWTRLRLLCVLS